MQLVQSGTDATDMKLLQLQLNAKLSYTAVKSDDNASRSN